MSPEELDEARAHKAYDEWLRGPRGRSSLIIAARLAREGWTPPEPEPEPEPVDPDLLAFREWRVWTGQDPDNYNPLIGHAYLAGARMARERERERAKDAVEYAQHDAARLDLDGDPAREALAKYEEGQS